MSELHQILGGHTVSYIPRRCSPSVFRCQARRFISELKCFKGQTWINISHHLMPPPCKRVGELFESKPSSIIGAPARCFRFPIYCSVSKPELVEGDYSRKSHHNLALFDHLVKFRGGVGEMPVWVNLPVGLILNLRRSIYR